ncbi:MAG TPA: winged helix-turn-helix domain-containing protein, partial [Paraburkholderia sp.]|uniref:winged helix-turn-helix domain-containing protein n=1 Tax=Paraburkholderia sp. TaxID=1926495 RepID=UPI002B497BB6
MELHVTVSGRRDLAGQIYRQLRDSIVDGRLAGGTRLPSTRDLALQLGVSRKTTLDVFERLLAEGYLNSRRGSGTFVAETLERLPARERGHPNPQIRAATAAITSARTGKVPRVARATPWWQAQAEALHGSLPRLDTRLACDFAGGVT